MEVEDKSAKAAVLDLNNLVFVLEAEVEIVPLLLRQIFIPSADYVTIKSLYPYSLTSASLKSTSVLRLPIEVD